MISILHPSRSRPKQAFETAKKWLSNVGADCEYILSLDDDDPSPYSNYFNFNYTRVLRNPNRSAVDAVNNAAKEARGNIIVVISDDFDCPKDWGKTILKATQGKTDWLLKVYDGAQKWIVTLPIMDRVFYESQGFIYDPKFSHLFCDTQLTHIADLQRKIIWRNDIEFEHQHYTTKKTEKDELNKRNDLTWDSGKKIYLNNCLKNFGLGEGINIYNLSETGHGHERWLQNELKHFKR